jgi:hypothetical protein
LVDLHGNLDLISGSWPGELFIFRGGPGRTFASPEMIKDRWGEEINIGGGVRTDRSWGDGSVFVAGTAHVEETSDGRVLVYHGHRTPLPKGKSVGITGTASSVHAFDWNGDGLIDLIVGNIDGEVWLIPNEGTKKEPAFGKPVELQVDGKPLRVEGDAGPCVADWDGDGLPDLIVGAGDGSVTFFRNVGTRQKPVLATGEVLVPASSMDWEHLSKEPGRGVRAKPCVVDWDGDGKLDLLVGDMFDQKPDLPPPTPEQVKLKAEYDELTRKYSELSQKRGEAEDEATRKKMKAELDALSEKRSAIQEKLPRESETHGWVWLFRRKSAGTKSDTGRKTFR